MKKLKSMTEEGVDGKNKRRNTVFKKATEKKFTEHNCSKDEGTKDEAGSKGDLAKSMRSNAVENEKLKNDLGSRDRVVTQRNSAGGGVLDKKAMAEKGSSAIGVKVGRGKNAAKKKVITEEENSEMVRSPVKRRNIDKKIAETVVSVVLSNEKSSYSLRPKRGIPSFRRVDLSESGFHRVVGKRVKVFWSDSRKWYTGKIELYDDKKQCHMVVYDDGTKQELDLKMQRFELEVMPGEAYTLSSKHEHFAGKKAMVDSDLVNVESVERNSRKVSAADQVKKYSKPTRVVTNAAKKGGSELLKREDSAKRMSSRLKKGDDISDVDILSSEIMKEVPLKIGDTEPKKEHSKPRKKTPYVAKNSGTRSQTGKAMVEMKEVEKASIKVGEVEPARKNSKQEKTMATKAAKDTVSKSQKRGSTEDLPSQKIVSNTVSNAKTQVLQKTKKVGGQINVENRKNPIRKGQENFKTRK